ncbi:hypothetical protein M407DRAFT_27587 [Tulasnella calospora MUT 4182]|uniref:Protein kinase domain-containing protein n=1 Tax=Tulasnella calospora MUT 4182 TaxID=1051891 RepID=A0A0C3LNJ4_9AGAM|nr:hypothetical protein M407DRAFT_27587 [Tulasnella calospora MUT 4182]
MNEELNEREQASQLTSAKDTLVDEVEDAGERLRICPRKVLGTLSHLRIDKARITPIEGGDTKAGGKADVEAAKLASAQSLSAPKSDDVEYVAVKKLRFDAETNNDRALAPLAHEVHLLNDLSHKNVIKILGFVEDIREGVAWMVFAWEKIGNLREFIRSTKWELPERVSLIDDVARGLSYLHGRTPPICHGDLKSLNILVNSENLAVITDFGSARAVDPATEGASNGASLAKATTTLHQAIVRAQMSGELTIEIAPSGEFITMTGPAWTVRWAAPELLEGRFPGLSSDIWALGWICWEAVTGNFPFDKDNDVAVVTRVTKGDLPTVENDNQFQQIKVLCSLMRECWKVDTSERPTALTCQQRISWMDQTVPSRREGSSLSVTRSSGLLHALGRMQLQNGMFAEAHEYFGKSLKVAESVGDERGQGKALQAIGDTAYVRGEHSRAEDSYLQARDIFSQIGDQRGLARSFRDLGDVQRMRSEYSKAEESYRQACGVYSQIGDQEGFAQSLKGLGEVYRMQDDYFKAEESFTQAREIFSQIGHVHGLARSHEGMGDIQSDRGEYTMAEQSYLEAQRIYQQIGELYSLANVSWYLGRLHGKHAQYAAAERPVREASSIYAKLGLKKDVEECDEFLEKIRRLIE